jgi:hypothetical protein
MSNEKLGMPLFRPPITNYIWGETLKNPEMFFGEWTRRLYTECCIWTCDIELNKNDPYKYDEGVRMSPEDDRPYTPSRIENINLPYFKTGKNGFHTLLENYPWQ